MSSLMISFFSIPRGTPFFTKLSGTVTATPGISLVKTSEDLTKEIRRGGKIKRYQHMRDDENKKEKKCHKEVIYKK